MVGGIQRYKQLKSSKPVGTIKSSNNQCARGWYCFDSNCNECVPNHVRRKHRIPNAPIS